MTKDKVVTARISSELKEKVDEAHLNISEAIEQALEKRTARKEEGTVIFFVHPYGIILQPMNYVVAELTDASVSHTDLRSKDFSSNSNTYHANVHQALLQLNKRLLEGKLKSKCKDKPLDLKGLTSLIQEHHKWFVDMVKGM